MRCQSKQKRVQRGNVTAKNKGTWAVSAEADDFFELSGGRLPPEDIALRYQSRPICVRRDSVTNKTKGAACSPLGAPHQGDIQGALSLDHFCILFSQEKDGGQCPLPSRVVVSIATRLRASRTVSQTRPRARHPAPVGAHLPVGDITLAGSARCQIAL